MTLIDVLIIGGGPAGLTAAMGLGRICRTAIVFDSQEYRNEAATVMNNVLGADGENPAHFRARCMEQIQSRYLGMQFVDRTVVDVETVSDSEVAANTFRVTDSSGAIWTGRKLLLATGSVDVLPGIPGFQQLWGKDIYHCLFCDGYERRNSTIGFLEVNHVDDFGHIYMARSMTDKQITIYTNAVSGHNEAVQKELAQVQGLGYKIDRRKIVSLSPVDGEDGVQVSFADGSSERLGFMLHHPPTENRAQNLGRSLGLELSVEEGGNFAAGSFSGRTNVAGCFVAGDTSTPWKIVTIAASTGAIASIAIAEELAREEAHLAYCSNY